MNRPLQQTAAYWREECLKADDEIERLRAENAMFAKVIVLGDEHFTGDEWEAALQAAERIVPLPVK